MGDFEIQKSEKVCVWLPVRRGTHPSFFLYLSAFPEIPAYLFGSLLPKVNLIAFYEKCLQSICNNSLYIYFLTILYIPYYAIRARTVKVC